MTTLMLVDGPNVMMRALYAAQSSHAEMSTSDGVATGALVIFINTLSRFIREEAPDRIVVCWEGDQADVPRRAILPSYKAARVKFSDPQVRESGFWLAEEFLSLCDIPSRGAFREEADDLIAHYWNSAGPAHTDKIIILSNDKDLLQLVGPNPHGVPTEQVRVSSYGTPTDRWGPERVTEHYGVPPATLAALLSIQGDKVDGVEGVPGLGPIKGARLLHQNDLSLDRAFPEGHEYRERVLTNWRVIDLRGTARYVLPPRAFCAPDKGSPTWPGLVDFCARYELNQVHDRLLTKALWTPRQDRPRGRRIGSRPAKTTARPT